MQQFRDMDLLRSDLDALGGAIRNLQEVAHPDGQERLARLGNTVEDFAARVTLVGQVKAGKTALTNALLGNPQLLPSDVNPWTSVVTSVHINKAPPKNKRAVFRFFDESEWRRLVEDGGRLGEMARRAKSQDELAALTRQLEEMQAKTRKRLGRNFELLLGKTHNYDDFDPALLERYVCLGEDLDVADKQGRFADLTKSADIYVRNEEYSVPLSLRDTPGVNDPFLVREQVTLQSLEDTDVCVVVLSAHQALSTMDMALLRVLLALRNEQIILFINRIDELADPVRQIPEIESHVRATLQSQKMPENVPILFGSAHWAEMGMAGDQTAVPDGSDDTLAVLAGVRGLAELSTADQAKALSGLAELQQAVFQQFREGKGAAEISSIARQVVDIAEQARALLDRSTGPVGPDAAPGITPEELGEGLDTLVAGALGNCQSATRVMRSDLRQAMDAAVADFIDRETRALVRIFNHGGKIGDWTPDASQLRRTLRRVYLEHSDQIKADVSDVFDNAARGLNTLYSDMLTDAAHQVTVKPPLAPESDAPVVLGQTMSIDMELSWWKRWSFARPKADAYAERFRQTVTDEVHPIILDIEERHVTKLDDQVRLTLHEFLSAHVETLFDLHGMGDGDGGARKPSGEDAAEIDARRTRIDEAAAAVAALAERFADPAQAEFHADAG